MTYTDDQRLLLYIVVRNIVQDLNGIVSNYGQFSGA
jgi:hypothetical protein